MLTSLPPIFVINLQRAQQRRAHITAQLRQYSLSYQLVNAVDGKLLSDDEMNQHYDENQARKQLKRHLLKAEIACALSHFKVYQQLLEEDIATAIVIEDDAVLTEQFIPSIQAALPMLPTDWQILLLGYNEYMLPNYTKPLQLKVCQVVKASANGINITLPLSQVFNTHAYIINQSGAKRLLTQINALSQPLDGYTGDRQFINVYCVAPRCVSVNYSLQSTIISSVHERIQDTLMAFYIQRLKEKFYLVRAIANLKRNILHHINCVIMKTSYKIKSFINQSK